MRDLKYERVAGDLRRAIEGGAFLPGEQLPIELELAEQFGVNRVTVRRALAVLTDAGLVRRERGKGTFVAKDALRALLLPALYVGDTESHLHRDLFLSVSGECRDRDTALLVFDAMDRGQRAAQRGARLRALADRAGAVIMDMDSVDETCEAVLRGRHCVRIYHSAPADPAQPGFQIQLDENGAAEAAVYHLVARGHRRIAFIGVHPDRGSAACGRFPLPIADLAPYHGFRRALFQHGIEEHRALGAYVDEAASETLYADFLRDLAGWATAIVCNSDWRALLLLHAAAAVGIRVPDELSIVGIGNTPWSEAARPKLTTVSLEERQAGVLAIHLCETPMPRESVICTIRPHLVPKESVSACGGKQQTEGRSTT